MNGAGTSKLLSRRNRKTLRQASGRSPQPPRRASAETAHRSRSKGFLTGGRCGDPRRGRGTGAGVAAGAGPAPGAGLAAAVPLRRGGRRLGAEDHGLGSSSEATGAAAGAEVAGTGRGHGLGPAEIGGAGAGAGPAAETSPTFHHTSPGGRPHHPAGRAGGQPPLAEVSSTVHRIFVSCNTFVQEAVWIRATRGCRCCRRWGGGGRGWAPRRRG